jgi:nucleoside-diphosphate-sugar epimerase
VPTLVTGATGFLGGHLVPLLLDRGDCVRAVVRDGTDDAALRGLGVDVVRGDALDGVTLTRAAEGCELVFHLVGAISYESRDRARLQRVNVESVRAALAAADPAARVVHVSSVAAIGPAQARDRPANEAHPYPARADRYVYPETKRAGEALVLEAAAAGRDALVASPGFLIGPGDVHRVSTWPVRRYLQGALRVLVEGGLSYVDARDVAAGLVVLSERGRAGGRTILTSRDGNLSHEAFFRRVGDVTGVRRRQIVVPASVAAAGARIVRWPVKPGEVAAAANWWFYDPAKAERELGFATRPIAETIAATAAQYC